MALLDHCGMKSVGLPRLSWKMFWYLLIMYNHKIWDEEYIE